eukprot:g32967.t1
MFSRNAFRRIARKNRRQNRHNSASALVAGAEALENRTLLSAVFGDFNGDGYDDLATGSPREDIGKVVDAGAINVIYGTYAGLASSGDDDWQQNSYGIEDQAETGDRFGEALAAGDFNNDGYIDLAIGVPGESVNGAAEAGAVQVIYGSAGGLTIDVPGTGNSNRYFHQDTKGIDDIAERFDRFGSALASGDFNGDGIADLAIGIPGENNHRYVDTGAVQVLFGSNSGLTSNGGQLLFQVQTPFAGDSAQFGDFFGAALAAGDFDGDGVDDLAIGVPGEDVGAVLDAGGVHVVMGSTDGLVMENGGLFLHQDTSELMLQVADSAEEFDQFGASLAAGDLNGDGLADLVVGVPGEDVGKVIDAGAVNVIQSGQTFSGLGPLADGSQFWSQNSVSIVETAYHGDLFGTAVAIADFDGDGDNDLAVGVPGKDIKTPDLQNDAGGIHIIEASGANGLTASGDRFFSQHSYGIQGTSESGDAFGSWLAAGHVDPTGRADLAISVPGEDIGSITDAGGIAVLYGTQWSSTFRTDNDQFWHQNVSYINGASEAGDSMGGLMPIGLESNGLQVPQFESNPGATNTIYLDFNGHDDQFYGLPIQIEAFDIDGQPETFNRSELAMIQDAWETVAEDYAPFDVNVTTIAPGKAATTQRIVFGGRWQDNVMANNPHQAGPANGIAHHAAFLNPLASNNAFVFTRTMFEDNRIVSGISLGNVGSHEAGHAFGLEHKIDYAAGVAESNEYSSGGSDWSPLMGSPNGRAVWTQAEMDHPSIETFVIKGNDDIGVLTDLLGRRNDDHANIVSKATALGKLRSDEALLVDTGIVETRHDVDAFVFDVGIDGTLTIDLLTNEVAANLDSVIEFGSVDTGAVIAIVAPGDDINATLTENVTKGAYYVKVKSENFLHGDVGQYTLRVQLAAEGIRPIGTPVGTPTGGTHDWGLLTTQSTSTLTSQTTSKTATPTTTTKTTYTVAKTSDSTETSKEADSTVSKTSSESTKIDATLDTRTLDVVFKSLELIPMRTDRERVTMALDSLVSGLFPYIEKEMKAVLKDKWLKTARSSFRENRSRNGASGEVMRWDAHSLLTVMWDQWNRVFRQKLDHHHRSLVSELREFRNRWAHQNDFDFDDTYRVLDSVERLLSAVGSAEAVNIHREKRDLLRSQFTREAKTAYRKTQLNRQKWKDIGVYGACGTAIVTVVLQLFGWHAWVVAVFVVFVFAYLAHQRFYSLPPMVFGPHECGTCAKIIYGEQCPYCDSAPRVSRKSLDGQVATSHDAEVLSEIRDLQKSVAQR